MEWQRTTVGQAKDLVAHLKVPFRLRAQALDNSRELDAEGAGCVRRHGIVTLTLEQVHAVETECLDLDDGIAGLRRGFGDRGDEEGGGGARASLDV